MKTLVQAGLRVSLLELLQIFIFMAPTNKCVINTDILSVYIPANLCPQFLMGIAKIRAFY